ncbi:hypothetical protein SAMN05216567_12192 [Variovorax sp. OK605]|jgi:ABC-type lipoprotein release transport system permease subunit|uniref:hypothetical protein n=1 Tax=Variovorax sp. OK605 TaxID=1855317 RepID=UPI0008EFBD7C|nr:hypothetical protein [Variovorax sp. OK605]SFQ60105.1 hypothetical protein SAMN05216567_12192 [Variovorax sp. OK605]
MKTAATRILWILAFAGITLAATAMLVVAGLTDGSQQGQDARVACLVRCPGFLARALK